MTIRAYTRIAAVVFIGLGLAGFFFALLGYPGFFGPGAAENLMHLIVGLLFGFLGFSSAEASILRAFVGGMGVLLLLGKAVLVGANLWGGESVFAGATEVVCVVASLGSILAARYLR